MKKDIISLGYYLALAAICFFFGLSGNFKSDIFLLSPLISTFFIGIGCALMAPQVTRDMDSTYSAKTIIALFVVFLLAGAFAYSILRIIEKIGFQAVSQIFDPFSIGLFLVSFIISATAIMSNDFGKETHHFFEMQHKLVNIALSVFAVWLIFGIINLIFSAQANQSAIYLSLGFAYIMVAVFSYNRWFLDSSVAKKLL